MTIGFVIKVIATICELLIPMALAYMIDDIVPRKRVTLIFAWGGVMLFFSFGALIGNITANRMASKVARNTTERIRYDLYEKISYLSTRQAEGFTMPSLISRATTDTYNIHQMVGSIQRLGVRAPIMLFGGIFLTFTMDVSLTLVMIALLPIMAICVFFISRKGIPMYGKVQEANDRFVRLMREDITGIRVIKALSKVDYEKTKFNQMNDEVVSKDQKAGLVMSAMNPLMSFLLNLGLVLIILVGAYRVNSGKLSPGTIVAFMSYVTLILNAILFMSRLFVLLSKASASARRIAIVLDSEPDLLKVPCEQENRKEQIVFDHVSFCYAGKEMNLENINFSLKRGESLGIIGATGAGKTTIINLLMRFYDVTEGSIYIDGLDVRGYDPSVLRQKFGTVFQNDIIFQDTIYENIRFSRNVTREQVIKAVTCAQALSFIQEKGLDSMLSIKGANLSGGQKQRLLIARALAADPEILILDDSSSALDYKTDAALRKAIAENYKDTTTIIIAQRISSIMNADKIIVMDDGKMIGFGNHKYLMDHCDIYREISQSQMGGDTE